MGKQNVHTIGELVPNTEIERQIIKLIGQLASTPIADLKQQWRVLIGREPPEFAKRSFLTQVIAWEMQAKAFGGGTQRQASVGNSELETVDAGHGA